MSDEQILFETVSAVTPSSIAEMIGLMESIDAVLTPDDGLKRFNLLYLMVTREVEQRAPAAGWLDPIWLAQLDVMFANKYFRDGLVLGWTELPLILRDGCDNQLPFLDTTRIHAERIAAELLS